MSGTASFSKLADARKESAASLAKYECIRGTTELAFTLAAARRTVALTQAEVARRMKTSQAAIARLESGRGKPTWETIERYAQALGRRLVVTLEPAKTSLG